MKIALAQLNYIPGDVEYNSKKIINAIDQAKSQNAEMVIFSELAVTGYPAMDLLCREEIITASLNAVKEIAAHCNEISAIVGTPSPNTGVYGKKLFNSAFFLDEGKVKAVVNKALLPTYDVFEEDRYFEQGNVFQAIDFRGIKIALTICEDIWDEQPCGDKGLCRYYGVTPLDELMKDSPRLIINIAANPFAHNRIRVREDIFRKKASKYKIPLISVNQTGGYTDIVFDGSSVVVDSSGTIIEKLAFCREELRVVEVPLEPRKDITSTNLKCYPDDVTGYIHRALVMGIMDFFGKSGQKKAVVGLSGGIDSAVVLALAAEALGPENTLAVLMPSMYSSKHSVTDSVEMVTKLGIPYHIVSIEESRLALEKTVKPFFGNLASDITEENIQARLRAVILMSFSNKLGYLVLNTSNKSEAATGYGTLYGDMIGGLSVLGDLYKTEVYKLAKKINRERVIIPPQIISKQPSAELKPDQLDTDSLPPYDQLDPILYRYIDLERSPEKIISEGYDADLVKKVVSLVRKSEFKRRQAPPILRVSSKAFGSGRKMPVISNY